MQPDSATVEDLRGFCTRQPDACTIFFFFFLCRNRRVCAFLIEPVAAFDACDEAAVTQR